MSRDVIRDVTVGHVMLGAVLRGRGRLGGRARAGLGLEVSPVVEAAEEVQEEERLSAEEEYDELGVVALSEQELGVVDEYYAELDL